MLPGRLRFKLVLGSLLAICPLAGAQAGVASIESASAAIDIVPRDIVSGNERFCMALAVFFEGGSTGESEEGQRHIARVVNERARSNRRKWGGDDICDVVFYNRRGVCQFTFACLPLARRTPRGGAAWSYALAIADDELAGKSPLEERSIRYYMNPALTPKRNACRFRKEFVPVIVAGRHHFFREATREERTALAASEFAECKRATASKKTKTHKTQSATGPAKKMTREAKN
jgi:spore germination cell wall hydrolase CwlJ-like protein